jgi:hypothetical protein
MIRTGIAKSAAKMTTVTEEYLLTDNLLTPNVNV